MKKLLSIIVLGFLLNGNAYSQETQLICSFNRDCINKSYDECKKSHYVNDKKIYKDIKDDEIENNWLKLTISYQIFDDRLISTMGLTSDSHLLNKAKVNSDKYYVFFRGISFSETRARFQIIAFDRNELVTLMNNFDTSVGSDGYMSWPEEINTEKKLLNYINYMFIKYKNPNYDDKKYTFQSSSICKIIGNVKPKF